MYLNCFNIKEREKEWEEEWQQTGQDKGIIKE
jgi:hypothetical protein